MVAFPLLPLTGPVVLEALRGVREHLLSYYDAQIWAVTRLGQVAVVLSEGFNPGAVLDGVSFTNPLDTVHSTSPPWARSVAGCRRARDHHPQDVMVLALWCTSNTRQTHTELAFRAELSTNGAERLELARVLRALTALLQNGMETLTSMRNGKTLEVRFRALLTQDGIRQLEVLRA
jgi:hypothetical protein